MFTEKSVCPSQVEGMVLCEGFFVSDEMVKLLSADLIFVLLIAIQFVHITLHNPTL